MRRFHATSYGATIIELQYALIIGAIVMVMGMISWVGGWKALEGMKYANLAYQDAYGTMNAIQEQVERSNTIEVPDPDNTGVPSIQLLIPNVNSETNAGVATNPLRRAFRLVGNNLIAQYKDEGNTSVTLFSDVTAFTATMLDAPTNKLVQLTCTCVDGTETVSTTTVAWRRN
jgi:Flp pilus assembly pilin Flp